jgi:hypothetical protein
MASEGLTYALLGIGVAGIIVCMGLVAFKSPDENANEFRKNLGIVAGGCGGAILLFAGGAFIYFSTHVNYLTPFLLIMTFINLFLSVFAISAASLRISSA